MSGKVECKLYNKIKAGEVLSEKEYRELGEIVKQVLTFMAKEKIIPSPQNYERWFIIFCYAKENNLKLTKADLIDLYLETFQVQLDKLERESVNLVEKIAEELYDDIQKLLKSISEHNARINERGKRLEEIASTVDTGALHDVLNKILTEVQGLKSINKKFMEKLEEQKEEIMKLREELRKVKEEANIDSLTGLRNRRSFERALHEFFRDYKKYKYPFSIIMLDIDNFKKINDTYGHLAGDKVLKEIGKILKTYLRAKDIPARTGGEEFTIILPGITKKEAMAVAERLRRVISNHTIEYEGHKIHVTASFGVAEMRDDIETPEDLLKEADEKLYKAKKTGKDKVVS